MKSKTLESVRLAFAAYEAEALAMSSRYSVATWVRVSRAESCVTLKPIEWQIWETAILAMAVENSDGVAFSGVVITGFGVFRFLGFEFGFGDMVGSGREGLGKMVEVLA